MKKIFTLTALLVLALAVNAQGYRKWDFTNWSAATVANLQADAAASSTEGWSDIEKAADASDPSKSVNGNCFWLTDANGGALKANGVEIAELEGLDFNSAYTSKRSLAIAVNYPSTSIGEYAGPQYLWLGGGGKSVACFTIPKVRVGQKITMTVESHKSTDARGVELYVGSIAAENKIGDSFKPTTQETYTWEEGWAAPEGVESETVDIIVYNTSGCHIYAIEIGDNSQKSKVAYLYNGNIDAELAYNQLKGNEQYEMTAVEATGAFAEADLTAYDAIVVSSTLNNAEAIASLKEIRPYEPMLNLNAALYEVWGYGTLGDAHNFAVVKNINHALFSGLQLITEGMEEGMAGLPLTNVNPFQGVNLTSGPFENDEVLAAVMESETSVAIHAHNISHNGYLFIPYTQEALADAANPSILNNAIKIVMNSKAKVSAAPKPSIVLNYKNRNTFVSIKSSVPSPVIYYTIDGSEPTEQSTLYTEPFNIASEGVTVKAIAKGDGYLLSDVAEQLIDLKDQSASPVITATPHKGYTTITMDCPTEGVSIYYNYSNSTDSTVSSKYTGAITLMTDQTITAFAASAVYVQSEPASQSIEINMPVKFTEQLAHMDAAKDPYYSLLYDAEDKPNTDSNSKVAYFFSWGKSKTAYSYYDTNADPIGSEEDPETGDITYIYPKNPEERFDFQNGWAVRSRGHVICTEITIKPGKKIGDGSTYNPATVDEFEFADTYPCTDFYVNISEWNTNYPRSGMIYTTKKFKGPFAVLSYISNGNSGTGPKVVFETGQDIDGDAVETEWKQIGDTCVLDKGQRLYQKFVRIYPENDEIYLRTRIADGGSKAGFYDIYVLGIDPASVSGIEEVADSRKGIEGEGIYSLNGVRMQRMQRGLNIVRGNDGIMKKVMVK